MKMLTIGQMAEINHVSKQTLHLYDRLGLLSPSERNNENSYRYYDMRQCAILDLIQYMKSLGMNLKEIKDYLDKPDPVAICEVFQQKVKQVEEEIQILNVRRHILNRAVENMCSYLSAPPDQSITLEFLPQRKIVLWESDVNYYDDYNIEKYEEILRTFQTTLLKRGLPQIYHCNAGTRMKKEALLSGNYRSGTFFLIVEDGMLQEQETQTIGGGMYLCMYCDNFYKEKDYIELMLAYARDHNYEITGDYYCEVLTEFPFTTRSERNMFSRMQVPIRFEGKHFD